MALEIIPFQNSLEERWDHFVTHDSVNGTFLQTRNFLNYHPTDRFEDASLLVMQGTNIVAVIPACATEENGKKCFFSHKGSTFGGILIDRKHYQITTISEIFELLEKYLKDQGFECAYIKNTSDVFAKEGGEILDYFFYLHEYQAINELSLYIDCERTNEDIISSWSSGRRRDYRYSLKNGLDFRKLQNDEELESFYALLRESLAKHGVKPVHTIEELKEFRDSRLVDIVDFYGVFHEEKLIAGTMLFYFDQEVLHTQYLTSSAEDSQLFPMNHLIYHLVKMTKENGFKKFSFGISTEDHGKILNHGLAVFKEGFGAQYCNNRSYYKEF